LLFTDTVQRLEWPVSETTVGKKKIDTLNSVASLVSSAAHSDTT
jgi:hypothetical protein